MARAGRAVSAPLSPGEDRRDRKYTDRLRGRSCSGPRDWQTMTQRLPIAGLVAAAVVCSGCLGPVSLHEAVLGYDQTVSRLERELLLVNIARLRDGLPAHFTVTSSIAA